MLISKVTLGFFYSDFDSSLFVDQCQKEGRQVYKESYHLNNRHGYRVYEKTIRNPKNCKELLEILI